MRIEWKPEYSVGIKLIDEQHQNFFRIVNNIFGLVEGKQESHDNLKKAIFDLSDYALYHLTTEEEYFEKFDYPDSIHHKEIHDLFRKKMMVYVQAIQNDVHSDKNLVVEVVGFAGNWLADHILRMDKKYTETFRLHGLI
ncbi:MAG: hemerythrin [Parcubacteria group bacterium LiPW_41]|nr:MAG: hemerythrin [Parcubacteria group bacterium LiPW_41]